MIQRRAAEIVDPVRPDRLLDLRPRQTLELGVWGVDDFAVPWGDVGEEGRALGRPLGFGDVDEPVGEGPLAGFVGGGGVCLLGGGHYGGFKGFGGGRVDGLKDTQSLKR